MKKKQLWLSLLMLLSFGIWTMLLQYVDVKVIGPNDSSVGFATINELFHRLTGVHMLLYHISDWAGLVPIAFCMGFAILGLIQWIARRRIEKVDHSILILGGFYLVVITLYLLFESCVINYRPILINGYLEASYPSSTTLLVLSVMPTSILQLRERINRPLLRQCITVVISLFTFSMLILRLISGVHWLSDIIGGVLLSIGLVAGYRFLTTLKE